MTSPSNHPASDNPPVSVWKLLWTYSRLYWKSIVLTISLSLTGAGLSSVAPLFMAPVLDIIFNRSSLATTLEGAGFLDLSLNKMGPAFIDLLRIDPAADKMAVVVTLCSIFVAASVLANILIFCSQLVGKSVQVRTWRDMQGQLFSHILSLPLSYLSRQRSGELISRLERDTGSATSGMDKIVRYLFSTPFQILFFGYLLISTNPYLALAAVLAAIVHFVITRSLSGLVRRSTVAQYSGFADQSVVFQEAISGIRLIKSFAAENLEIQKFRQNARFILVATMRQYFFEGVQEPLRNLANQLVVLSIIIFSANELLQGRLEASGFVLFVYVGQRLIGAIKLLGETFAAIQVTSASAERVNAILAFRPPIKDGRQTPSGFERELRFESVTFSYGDDPILHGIDLTVKRGEMVALVGPSGGGKSTLVDLALRLHDPQQGQILFDDVDIRQFRQFDYRKLFGVVSQETFLFNTSIRDNIIYGRDNISDDDVIAALQVANSLDFVQALPNGLDSLIGDRGVRLSGGQRQRLAIARAVIGHPQILVMDEATSALDSESEKLVQAAIERVISDTTAIVIAHRLSTVLHADRIYVIEQGRVVDAGRHSELLERCGLYARLCRHQFNMPQQTDVGQAAP